MWAPGVLSVKNFKSLNCNVLSAMPYLTNGKKYLTPINAVDAILEKTNSSEAIFCLMVTATTELNFVSKIKSLANCWALPDFNKALRISQTLVNLDANKMILPAPDVSTCSVPLSTPQSRAILASKKIGQVKALNVSAMQSNITHFTTQQKQLISEMQNQSNSIASEIVQVNYYFGIANELKKDIPNENHVFTLMIGFTGADIIKLIGLMI